ncbi:MAG: vitamin B12-dependent ribonucleotide reductase, partial [Planctomycetota bacterium]
RTESSGSPAPPDQTSLGNGPDAAVQQNGGVAVDASAVVAPVSSVMKELAQDAGAAVALAERATLLAGLHNGTHATNGNGRRNGVAEDHLSGRADQFSRFQTDAPSCDNCGSITVRNGNCYLCHNCGNSMGCS